MLLALLFGVAAVVAGWLSLPGGSAEKAATPITNGLERAAAYIKSLPPKSDGVALAGQATQEGHWRFVNRAGETFTAGTSEEMRRAATVLHPEVKAGARLALYVAEETIFGDRAALKALPASAELFLVTAAGSYRVLKRADGPVERLFAEIRPSLVVEFTDPSRFREAEWQLARPLDKAGVRVLGLEPGGPAILSTSPRADPDSGRPLIDAIDPERLPGAMSTVRGQMLLVTGRIAGDLMYFQPSSGRERTVSLNELFRAAEAADVNLIVLHAASTPRQPGGRNWLWLRVKVDGLDEAMQRARLADFLNALGGPNRRLAAVAMRDGARTLLTLTPAGDFPGTGTFGPVADFFSGIVSDISGKVVTTTVQANLRSAERQQELDRRLVPGVPSSLQIIYLAMMGFGMLGVPLSRAWWARAWPPETAADYAGRIGFWAATVARALAYALIFMPATGVVAAPWNLYTQIAEGVATPVRWMRRRGRQGAAANPDQGQESAVDIPGKSKPEWPSLDAIGNVVPRR